jgi:hypothetical protein
VTTPFTLVMAYYENAGMLREQLRLWEALPREIAANLHVRIVDDGSPDEPAENWCDDVRAYTFGDGDGLASFELWRMGVDVRWNQDACRNIGVREAPTQWIMLTDMDHVVPADTWRRLMFDPLNAAWAYTFDRVDAPNLTPYKPHPNTWAMTRDRYWMAGGYDEALAGNYGTDGDFKVRVNRCTEIHALPEVVVRYSREVIPDASTTTLQRKSEQDRATVSRLVKSRATDPTWKPLHFSFPCERVR